MFYALIPFLLQQGDEYYSEVGLRVLSLDPEPTAAALSGGEKAGIAIAVIILIAIIVLVVLILVMGIYW